MKEKVFKPPRSLMERYLFIKSYTELLKSENRKYQQEIGILKSDIEELRYKVASLEQLSEEEEEAIKNSIAVGGIRETYSQEVESVKAQLTEMLKEKRSLTKENITLRKTISRLVDIITQ